MVFYLPLTFLCTLETNNTMNVAVGAEQFRIVLEEVKNKGIGISIRNHSGRWTDEYFVVDELKEFGLGCGKLTALIVHSPNHTSCAVIDLRAVTGIRLDHYLDFAGQLWTEVAVSKPSFPDIQLPNTTSN
jgi:hypothetical protein